MRGVEGGTERRPELLGPGVEARFKGVCGGVGGAEEKWGEVPGLIVDGSRCCVECISVTYKRSCRDKNINIIFYY